MANLQIYTPNVPNESKQIESRPYTSHWKPQLFLSIETVKPFKCVKCSNIPKCPHGCDQNHLFCEHCVKTSIEQNHLCPVGKHKLTISKKNELVSNLINDLEIKCIHCNLDNHANEYVEEGNVDDTKQPESHCDWTGRVKDITVHLKQNCKVQRSINRERRFHELQQQNEAIKDKLHILQTTIERSSSENTSLQQQLRIKNDEIHTLNQTINALKVQSANNTELEAQLLQKTAENKQLKKHIQGLEHQLKQMQYEKNILTIKQSHYDKYDDSQDDVKSSTQDTQHKFQSMAVPNLIITKDSTETLESHDSIIYDIDKLVLEENAVLTVKPWNYLEKCGGFLNIRVKTNIVMKKGSKITVSGLGYQGGKVMGSQGESYLSVGRNSTKNNNGGGGGGQTVVTRSQSGATTIGHGGGGSYGSKGIHGWSDIYGSLVGGGSAGDVYGDETLETLHRGSGGGCSGKGDFYGGNGGGIIRIQCNGVLIMEKDAVIEANGTDGHKEGGGGGSGGSIRIVSNSVKMDDSWFTECKITANGGDASGEKAGKGGDGRICCLIEDITQMQKKNIKPSPYMG